MHAVCVESTATDSVTLTVSDCFYAAGERANKDSECTGCWRGGEEGDGHGDGGVQRARAAEQREGQGIEERRRMLIPIFEVHNLRMKELIGKEFAYNTYKKYKKEKQKI